MADRPGKKNVKPKQAFVLDQEGGIGNRGQSDEQREIF